MDVLVMIVIAYDVKRINRLKEMVVLVWLITSCCNRTCRVKGTNEVSQLTAQQRVDRQLVARCLVIFYCVSEVKDKVCLFQRQRVGFRVTPLLQYLVTYTPDTHRGVVAVTTYEVCKVTLVPLVKETCIVARCLLPAPHIESLIHHEEAHLITKFK